MFRKTILFVSVILLLWGGIWIPAFGARVDSKEARPDKREAPKAKPDRTYDQLKLLLDILTYTQQNYVEEVDTQKLIYSAAAGMLRPLDPFSQFMEPRRFQEMKI